MMIDNKKRCSWCLSDPLYVQYHDEEWGIPIHNDRRLFEMLILEGAQAGLSWLTILKKRENYRHAFDNFDIEKVANYSQEKFDELLNNKGIVRNRLKIQASISNAQYFLKLQEEFGSFATFLWEFVEHKQINNSLETLAEGLTSSAISDKISKELKRRGFKFVGTTIIYAYMQSVGLVNDHLNECWRKDIAGVEIL